MARKQSRYEAAVDECVVWSAPWRWTSPPITGASTEILRWNICSEAFEMRFKKRSDEDEGSLCRYWTNAQV